MEIQIFSKNYLALSQSNCCCNTAELTSVLEQNKSANKFILGGGSNMLLTKDIDALVIHIDLREKNY
jgi:UDP-N-acetylenolpyruvoylglucosamine reductase